MPACVLPKIKRHLDALVLRVHVGQLAGQITSGSHAACFDWGTNWPWRWPADIMLKVCLAVWATTVTHVEEMGAGWHLASCTFVVVSCTFVGILSLVFRPYVHFVDNLAVATSLFSCGACSFLRVFSNSVHTGTTVMAVALAILVALPVGIFCAATCAHMNLTVCRIVKGRPQQHAAAAFVTGWGDQGVEKVHRARREMMHWCDGKTCDDGYYPLLPQESATPHQCEVRLLFDQEVQRRRNKDGAASALHAWVRPPLVFARIGVDATIQHADVHEAWLSLPPHLLFPSPTLREGDLTADALRAIPIACFVEQPDILIRFIYVDVGLNDGREWRQVVTSIFSHTLNSSYAKEAIQLIEKYDSAGPKHSGDRAVIVFDITDAVNARS